MISSNYKALKRRRSPRITVISRPQPQKRVRKSVHRSETSESKLVPFIPRAWQRRRWQTTSVAESFYHAFRGLGIAFGSERNLRIHSISACLVIIAGVLLKVDLLGACLLTIAVGFVIVAELVNTALERLVDISTEGAYHRLARDAKDVAAAAVLFSAMVAAVVGCLVFMPRVLALFGYRSNFN